MSRSHPDDGHPVRDRCRGGNFRDRQQSRRGDPGRGRSGAWRSGAWRSDRNPVATARGRARPSTPSAAALAATGRRSGTLGPQKPPRNRLKNRRRCNPGDADGKRRAATGPGWRTGPTERTGGASRSVHRTARGAQAWPCGPGGADSPTLSARSRALLPSNVPYSALRSVGVGRHQPTRAAAAIATGPPVPEECRAQRSARQGLRRSRGGQSRGGNLFVKFYCEDADFERAVFFSAAKSRVVKLDRLPPCQLSKWTAEIDSRAKRRSPDRRSRIELNRAARARDGKDS